MDRNRRRIQRNRIEEESPEQEEVAREAFRLASYKLPVKTKIIVD